MLVQQFRTYQVHQGFRPPFGRIAFWWQQRVEGLDLALLQASKRYWNPWQHERQRRNRNARGFACLHRRFEGRENWRLFAKKLRATLTNRVPEQYPGRVLQRAPRY